MTTTTNMIERLRLGASISRDRKINHDYSDIADWAADTIEAQAKQIEALESEWRPTPCQATLHACITYLVHGKADFSGLPDGLVNTLTTKIEALQADAERYNFVIRYLVSERTDLDNAIVAATKPEDITKVIDAARKGNV